MQPANHRTGSAQTHCTIITARAGCRGQVFLQKQLEIREGKDKVVATWIRDVITHDLGILVYVRRVCVGFMRRGA